MVKATALVFFLGALLLSHAQTGESQPNCTFSDVRFAVERTGKAVGGQPEDRVTFSTACPCKLTGVRVWCDGVQDGPEQLDESKVEFDDGMCVLRQPIAAGSPLSFTYTSRTPVNFRLYSATADC
ncbi:uncharacterized protein LOC102720283 [Oryza brachyantha]|uniref:Uncharacterized protein n=1 Tax=Oryza brachyantha TaxID=4533 RepID=J3N8J4_ORYBR|nr:uncharacterized protein LOC102720283 [Oryza brachyantha]